MVVTFRYVAPNSPWHHGLVPRRRRAADRRIRLRRSRTSVGSIVVCPASPKNISRQTNVSRGAGGGPSHPRRRDGGDAGDGGGLCDRRHRRDARAAPGPGSGHGPASHGQVQSRHPAVLGRYRRGENAIPTRHSGRRRPPVELRRDYEDGGGGGQRKAVSRYAGGEIEHVRHLEGIGRPQGGGRGYGGIYGGDERVRGVLIPGGRCRLPEPVRGVLEREDRAGEPHENGEGGHCQHEKVHGRSGRAAESRVIVAGCHHPRSARILRDVDRLTRNVSRTKLLGDMNRQSIYVAAGASWVHFIEFGENTAYTNLGFTIY